MPSLLLSHQYWYFLQNLYFSCSQSVSNAFAMNLQESMRGRAHLIFYSIEHTRSRRSWRINIAPYSIFQNLHCTYTAIFHVTFLCTMLLLQIYNCSIDIFQLEPIFSPASEVSPQLSKYCILHSSCSI